MFKRLFGLSDPAPHTPPGPPGAKAGQTDSTAPPQPGHVSADDSDAHNGAGQGGAGQGGARQGTPRQGAPRQATQGRELVGHGSFSSGASPETAPETRIDVLIDDYPGPSILLDAAMAALRSGPALADLGPDLLTSDWGPDLIDWARAARTAKAATSHTTTFMTDRGVTMIEWCATALPDGNTLLLGRDVTLERHLREALADSRQRFRDMVDMACDFSFETDAEGKLIYVSSDGALGYPADALVGAHFSILLAIEGMQRTPFEARRPVRLECIDLKHVDGRRVPATVSSRPLLDDQGEWAGARGVVMLVTAGAEGEPDMSQAPGQPPGQTMGQTPGQTPGAENEPDGKGAGDV